MLGKAEGFGNVKWSDNSSLINILQWFALPVCSGVILIQIKEIWQRACTEMHFADTLYLRKSPNHEDTIPTLGWDCKTLLKITIIKKTKQFCMLLISSTPCIFLTDCLLLTVRVIVYWEWISLSVSCTLSESVITMVQISAGSPSLSRLRRAWKRISGVGCQTIGPELFIPLKPIHTLHV